MSALALGFQAKYGGLDRGEIVRNNMICTEKYAENTVGLNIIEIIQIVDCL
jgi:hypothetical protein